MPITSLASVDRHIPQLTFQRKDQHFILAVCIRPSFLQATVNVTFYKDSATYEVNEYSADDDYDVRSSSRPNMFAVDVPREKSGNYSCEIGYVNGASLMSEEVLYEFEEEPVLVGPRLTSFLIGSNLTLNCSYKDNNYTISWFKKDSRQGEKDLGPIGTIYELTVDFVEKLSFICYVPVNGKILRSLPFQVSPEVPEVQLYDVDDFSI